MRLVLRVGAPIDMMRWMICVVIITAVARTHADNATVNAWRCTWIVIIIVIVAATVAVAAVVVIVVVVVVNREQIIIVVIICK